MISCASRTDPGRVRTGNEDAYAADLALGLFAVADGLGGHQGGEVASRLAIDTLCSFVKTSACDPTITWPDGFNTSISCESNQLRSAVLLAHRRIRHQATLDAALEGMGTTIVAGLLRDTGKLTYVTVGDSRLYLWRARSLSQLSEDDTWIASMIRAGAEAESLKNHHMQHMLTKALGSMPALELAPRETSLMPGDLLLMCSDGLYGPIGNTAIARILEESAASLEQAAQALVDAANAAGGPDNVTVVLVRYD